MSGSISGTKPIFPIPISGQTLMFSTPNCHSNVCEQGRGNIHTVQHSPNSTRCSCGGLSNNTTGFNRLLIPAGTHTDQCTAQIQANLTNNAESWLRIPAAARNNSTYEQLLLNGFPLYGKFNSESYPSLDYALLANARRKNATRETTSTLKAWLNEHKKNPYPTKGEKIMLAILTKMTLTQVSTWFANARRRLKKENKMTWSPRKKSGEKKLDGKEDDSDASDSDVECMDVDVDGDPDSPLLEEKEGSSTKELEAVGLGLLEKPSGGEELESEVQRPSVIRTIDSPTFNEIRDRFKNGESPVTDLQKWVNGCFQGQEATEPTDFSVELTPPSTPIENKITTFTSQKLFEAFDKSKTNKLTDIPIKEEPTYNSEPLSLIFSSRQPVCSTKVESSSTTSGSSTSNNNNTTNKDSTTTSKEVPPSVITPQPSPKNVEFTNPSPPTVSPPTLPSTSQARPITVIPPTLPVSVPSTLPTTIPSTSADSSLDVTTETVIETGESLSAPAGDAPPRIDYRVQGLTTCRELEAVLALTNLCKT